MAYSATPAGFPSLVAQDIGGKNKHYAYRSTDNAAAVRAAGYITNGPELGIKVGNTIVSIDTDDATLLTTNHAVVSVNATTGAVDLSDGSVGSGANT